MVDLACPAAVAPSSDSSPDPTRKFEALPRENSDGRPLFISEQASHVEVVTSRYLIFGSSDVILKIIRL